MAPALRLTLAVAATGLAACAGRRVQPPPKPAPTPPPEPVALAAPGTPAAASVSVALSTSATLQEMLAGIEAAYRAGRYDDGLTLVKRTLETRRKDLSVYDRVGSVYYLLGRYGEVLAVWEQAFKASPTTPRASTSRPPRGSTGCSSSTASTPWPRARSRASSSSRASSTRRRARNTDGSRGPVIDDAEASIIPAAPFAFGPRLVESGSCWRSGR